MISTSFRSCVFASALMLAFAPSMAQQLPVTSTDTPATTPTIKTFSQQELDQILAPIALYPDALLAQTLMGSTYPLEVIEAARWAKANPNVSGKALEDAMAQKSWDPSVKSLTAVPQVLQQMSDRLDWLQKLGNAFLAQQKDVLDTVQSLRAKAAAEGNLTSSEQQVIKTETEGDKTIYVIESPKTEVVYVPIYNPYVVYGTWWYPYPPYYMYPPHYVYPPHVAFTGGIIVGVALWGNCNWRHSNVYVNVNHYNSYNRTNISNGSWNHNVDHRGGVAYPDHNVAKQYNRGGDMQSSKARDDYRGRGDSGNAARPSSRDTAGTRDGAGGGFSGANNGNSASTREASQRGSSSRASYGSGGGYSGGGGRGGGYSGGGGGRGGGGGGRR
jgi:Protein of unknown function (DUF3300)